MPISAGGSGEREGVSLIQHGEAASVGTGRIAAVRGSVVDVHFDGGLPPINQKLVVEHDPPVMIEVAAHLDHATVRGMALSPPGGLARGMTVTDSGGPFMVPVGDSLLGRMLNIYGLPIDRLPPPEDVTWRSIHQPPVPLARRETRAEIFETGIKAIDLLAPLERGGKAVRRCRCR
jgi:F-type H+-transporting ATPase subunit beta